MRPSWLPPPDGSRDRRIEDPTNLYIVHLTGRALLPLALRSGISANSVSIAGFALGAAGGAAFYRWSDWRLATLGLLLGVTWLIADGLDGMIARATRTASAYGRFLDGLCDHGVFVLLYVALASSIGSLNGWLWALSAGACHAVQSTLYEGERTRFHRRLRGDLAIAPSPPSRNPLVRAYDGLAGSLDRISAGCDHWLGAAPDFASAMAQYGEQAVPPLRLMALLTNNMRLVIIYLACLAGDPRWFWLIELTVLNAVCAVGIVWLRTVESRMVIARAEPAAR